MFECSDYFGLIHKNNQLLFLDFLYNFSKNRKNSLSYRKLRRWVLPAVLGAALSTLAVIPTLAAETQTNTNVAVVTTTEQTKTVPSAQGSTPPNGAPHGKPPAGHSPTGTSNQMPPNGNPPSGTPNGIPPTAMHNGAVMRPEKAPPPLESAFPPYLTCVV